MGSTVNVREKYLGKSEKISFIDRIYLPAILKGMFITLKHFLFSKPYTTPYPFEKKPVAERFRGRHVLKRDEEGKERCTACYCCQYICPAQCITIVAEEVPADQQKNYPEDKYAKSFEIDLLRCIFCGFCQNACPKAAIFLEHDYDLVNDSRDKFILTKEKMLATEGGPRKIRK